MDSPRTSARIADQAVWDAFIQTAAPHSFLQSWQWGDFNEKTNTEILRYGIYDGALLRAVALVLIVRARRGTFLLIPHGPIFLPGLSSEAVMSLLETLTAELRAVAQKQGAVCIRISSLLPDTPPYRELFKKLGYRNAPVHLVHPELAWILDLRPTEEELLRGMRKSTRYSIKKAEKDGVSIRMSTDVNDVETFWSIYSKTVARQQFAPFSKEYLAKEFEVFVRDNRAALFFAEYRGTATATALIIFDKSSAYYHHGATTQEFPGLTDAQLLQWRIIQEAKKRGCAYYNFWGIVAEERQSHPWQGLSIFKRGFGGTSEAYLHAQDMVCSPKYWITYSIERVRRLQRGL